MELHSVQKTKFLILLKILEHWVIANGMLTEKQTIGNLSFSILTSCRHTSQISA